MNTRGFIILAACLAVTMAEPVQNRAVEVVIDGINLFSSAFFGEVSLSNPDNLVISPISASIALSMAGYGARGEPQREFKRVLHLPEESVARTGYANLIDSINAVKNVELRLANKIFINDKLSVKPTFRELTQTAFRSASENVNFASTQTAADTINQWCEQQTNNRIKNLVAPEQISDDTSIMLVNAIYFKGNWANPFDPLETTNEPFHVTKSQAKNVPTMHMLDSFKYGVLPEYKAKFVELPYKGEELSMIIILPDEVDGLHKVEQRLAIRDLTKLIKIGYQTEVSLSLPKFKMESTYDLRTHIINMGIRKGFDSRDADFSGISDDGIRMNSVVQKAFIEVNEKGSEAAVVTGLFGSADGGTNPLKPPVNFAIDRPFFYSIVRVKAGRDDRTVMPLIMGHVTEPKL